MAEAEEAKMAEEAKEANWYVVHTYSGYENTVKTSLEQAIKNRNLQDEILEIRVPLYDVVEIKNGVRKAAQKKMLPSYILVKMVMNTSNWYVVRNTRGVTGFVGPEGKPIPLSEEEMQHVGIRDGGIVVDFEVGDSVIVINGVWEGTIGAIKSINPSKQMLTIMVDMFGRETPVELEFNAVRKM